LDAAVAFDLAGQVGTFALLERAPRGTGPPAGASMNPESLPAQGVESEQKADEFGLAVCAGFFEDVSEVGLHCCY